MRYRDRTPQAYLPLQAVAQTFALHQRGRFLLNHLLCTCQHDFHPHVGAEIHSDAVHLHGLGQLIQKFLVLQETA